MPIKCHTLVWHSRIWLACHTLTHKLLISHTRHTQTSLALGAPILPTASATETDNHSAQLFQVTWGNNQAILNSVDIRSLIKVKGLQCGATYFTVFSYLPLSAVVLAAVTANSIYKITEPGLSRVNWSFSEIFKKHSLAQHPPYDGHLQPVSLPATLICWQVCTTNVCMYVSYQYTWTQLTLVHFLFRVINGCWLVLICKHDIRTCTESRLWNEPMPRKRAEEYSPICSPICARINLWKALVFTRGWAPCCWEGVSACPCI